MSSQDAEALVELAQLCSQLRASLPASGPHRLRVLLDMVLIDLAREGFGMRAGLQPEPARRIRPLLRRKSP